MIFRADNIPFFEPHNYRVYYQSKSFRVYASGSSLRIEKMTGELIHRFALPPDSGTFQVIEDEVLVYIVFAGKYLLKVSENRASMEEIDPLHIGQIVFFRLAESLTAVVGTRINDHYQVIRLDLEDMSRISQSASKPMKLSDLLVTDNLSIATYGKVIAMAYDGETCELKWSRFEAAGFDGKIVPYVKGFAYISQGSITQIEESSKNKTAAGAGTVVGYHENIMYHSLDDTLSAFDLLKRSTLWTIPIKERVLQLEKVDASIHGALNTLLICRSANSLSFITTAGQTKYILPCENSQGLSVAGDSVIVQKQNKCEVWSSFNEN